MEYNATIYLFTELYTVAIAYQINVLSPLSSETLILTKEAVAKIEEVFAGEKSA